MLSPLGSEQHAGCPSCGSGGQRGTRLSSRHERPPGPGPYDYINHTRHFKSTLICAVYGDKGHIEL